MADDGDEILTVKEVAAILKCGEKKVRSLAKKLNGRKLDDNPLSHWRFRRSDVERYRDQMWAPSN